MTEVDQQEHNSLCICPTPSSPPRHMQGVSKSEGLGTKNRIEATLHTDVGYKVRWGMRFKVRAEAPRHVAAFACCA